MATPIPRNQAPFSWAELVAATGGSRSGPAQPIQGIAIDSRSVEPGNLFVALRGEKHDAHQFVPSAIALGATAVAIDRDMSVAATVGCLRVDDTLRALGALARTHRDRFKRPVVALTGSAGKTSTKELIAAALAAAGDAVHSTRGNLNNLIGLPMTLLGLSSAAAYAVVELGTNAPGEIARLSEIAAPDVGLVTSISLAHSEGLGTLASIAAEKTSLLDNVARNGIAIINADDAEQRRWAALASGPRVLRFGASEDADVRLSAHRIDPATLGTHCELVVSGRRIEFKLRLLGEGAALNATAAMAVAHALGVDPDAAARGIAACEPAPGRLALRPSWLRALIDDTYNANPASTRLAIRTLRAVADALDVRPVIALGDMKELGLSSTDAHREIGSAIAEARIGLFIAVGDEMRNAAAITAARRVDTIVVDSVEDAVAALSEQLRDGDVLLVKGSRSMSMERVADAFAIRGEGAS